MAGLYIAWINIDIYIFGIHDMIQADMHRLWLAEKQHARYSGLMKGLWNVHGAHETESFIFILVGLIFTHVNHFYGECTVSLSPRYSWA